MGGLGPGIGGLEILVIGLLALIVVGPKDLPLLMRKVGKAVGKARAMANEFRSSFDEMARQSELDELRKEVEALRTGQGMVPLGAEAEATFRDISDDLNRPLDGPSTQPALSGPEEWPDSGAVMKPLEASAEVTPQPKAKPKARAGAKASSTRTTPARTASARTASGKSRPIRPKKVDL
ncbi:MAG: Sec-independent protein translocase protein TatB [Brevundimonas sp.]|uniref:Sec-independent protein translocase protein TatB n=1 Tax=Brevundimonas sp. TaxID=1871086 RepID=UPI002ABB7C74|nr:Sec-independent protein translocase protein TatB [Brevundimonas sp.]MDZ4113849.1 Sec-independent protein translocase protein TatB [Brevundimonas sp.]